MRSSLHLAIVFALPLSSAFAEGPNPWPQKFQARPAKVITTEATKQIPFAYETANFRIQSDAAIKATHLAKFATVIESVPQLINSLPLELHAPPSEKKPRIILCKDSLNYHSQGGAIGTSGYYDGRHQCIYIRADIFLNPPPSQPTRLRPRPNEDLLVHEVSHLVMHDLLWPNPPWFTEGLAEYMAAAHTGAGTYDFTHIDTAVRDHIRRRLQPNQENHLVLPSIRSIINTSSRQWLENGKRADATQVYRPYAVSLLLIHYHLRSKERRAAIANQLTLSRAHRGRRLPFPRMDLGDTTEIETRLTKFWQPKGLPIRFIKE